MKNYLSIFKEYLKKKGQVYTSEMKEVLDEIFKLHAHFTLNDLSLNLKDKGLSRAFITEVISLLVEAGLIRKILSQDKIYYEDVYKHAHHDHLICVSCGKVCSFYDPLIEKEQERVAQRKGYQLLKHSLELSGLCPDCQKKRDKETEGHIKKENLIPISMISPGEKVRIVKIRGGQHFLRRLSRMGVRPHETVEIISNDFEGPFLLKVKEVRIALGHGMAHKIMVKRE